MKNEKHPFSRLMERVPFHVDIVFLFVEYYKNKKVEQSRLKIMCIILSIFERYRACEEKRFDFMFNCFPFIYILQ